ncbi:DUF2206 domain-containing protein [Streptomyces sp. NPDC003487]
MDAHTATAHDPSARPDGPQDDQAAHGGGRRGARRARRARMSRRRYLLLVSLAPAVMCLLLPGMPGLLTAPAGLWLLFGAPVLLWMGTAARSVASTSAAFLLATGLTVVTDMVLPLTVNTVLPLVGNDHPLTRVNLTAATALFLVALGRFGPEHDARPEDRLLPLLRGLWGTPGFRTLAGALVVLLVLSVAGPIRLNNGLGGGVSVFATAGVAVLLVLLLLRRGRYPSAVVEMGLYAATLCLLLLNSLRGWYIAGHDIQVEYLFHKLTLVPEHWDVGAYPDPYMACLSITLLPVTIFKMTGIPDIYIFKVVLPVIFAITPVLLYRAVSNVAPRLVALVAAVFFLAFPTFFTDMTFLGRQEIAFVLLGCAVLVLTDYTAPRRNRRITFTVLLVGVALAHYSTIYMVVGTLVVSYVFDKVWRLRTRMSKRGGRGGARRRKREAGMLSFLVWWMFAIPAAVALTWAGPITHSGGQLEKTLSVVADNLLNPSRSGGGSSDTSYSLLGGTKASESERLADYRAELTKESATDRAEGVLLPESVVRAAKTPVDHATKTAPTLLGRAIEATGLGLDGTHRLLRTAISALFQVILVIGFWVALKARRSMFRPVRDQVTIAVGAWTAMVAITVVPQLSVDYGVLRAFQQGLFFFSPFLAAGLIGLLRWTGRRLVPVVSLVLALMFAELTGVFPALTGGFNASMALSNSGTYYEVYYPHPGEHEAAAWLNKRIAATGSGRIQTDRFTYMRLRAQIFQPTIDKIDPEVLRTDTYVLLGDTTVRTGRVTVFFRGDLISYDYPTDLLEKSRNRIYDNGQAEVYR